MGKELLFLTYVEKSRGGGGVSGANIGYSPLPGKQILDSSKLKEFADDNFKLGENGRKLSKRVENTVGKGEIARYEQFLLFPQCV